MKSLHLSADQIRTALLQCDTDILTLETLQKLQQFVKHPFLFIFGEINAFYLNDTDNATM